MKADRPPDMKTPERTEGAAKVVQAMHGDSSSAFRVDPDPMYSTSFGDDYTGPRALPYSRDDTLVGNGAAAPKSCLSPLGDALTNSRRWLTLHWQNLYTNEDHLPLAASLVLPSRGDKFEDFDLIRLVREQFL